ncbi:hypothetical protein JMJ77_0012552 [Colletotrichum scovillei]|uniref:Uncharacterized protein n=1 Tax=Colletotrichum scovillei TaxID=1209932 RepID=A0A9P7R6H3_9PEZI|nr:hypothetical protein JMJ77_0012552 [Colletotrichum scovillei]KAG7068830.1 hypothetical protein JMJ76_0002510 [Colletotrichum scovillei]KAG7072786.1 hypothetical protein JMJ78_0013771 [Colletotrichum scovillei]
MPFTMEGRQVRQLRILRTFFTDGYPRIR